MVREEAVAAAFAAALLGPDPARAQTVDWFDRNAAARTATLRHCENDHSQQATAACLNARASETRAYARRIGPNPLPEIEPMAPFVRQGIARACARPPSERGMFAAYCKRGT